MSDTTYTFQIVDLLGYGTGAPGGINNAGTIVGYVTSDNNGVALTDGFSGTVGDISTFSFPGNVATLAFGINSAGVIVGYHSPTDLSGASGFILDSGTFTSVQILPIAIQTYTFSINAAGDTAGYYEADIGGTYGEYGYTDIAGVVTTIDGPAGSVNSIVTGINNADDYVGDASIVGSRIAFEVVNGTTTSIAVPGAFQTQVTGINNEGVVVGTYWASEADLDDGVGQGFIYQDGQYQTLDYPDEVIGTTLDGINDLGQIVGVYNQDDAFLATPEATPCYCRGTRLLTAQGDVAVEDLRIDDRLITHAGIERPIRWIGTRSYAGRFAASNPDVLPILIRAGALSDGIPSRDLRVSPLHAMYLDGRLVPAAALVNGISIEQVKDVDQVDYFHVELDTHDVILAEGAASETFVDDDSRGIFHNAADYYALYPQAVPLPAIYCAPRLEGGPVLEALVQRLKARACATPAATTAVRPLGNLESVDRERIVGWAHDRDRPDRPVRLRILDNGMEIGRVTARLHRQDLWEAGFGDGRGGFYFIVPGGLSPLVRHVIEVQHAEDGRALANAPWVLPAQADAPAAPWSKATDAGLDGYIDELTRMRISGWVRNIADPDRPVALQIFDNGVPIARVLANRYRPDLARAKPGAGRCGFEHDIPGGLSPLLRHVIAFQREPDGLALDGPPFVIEAETTIGRDVEQAIADAVNAVGSAAAQQRLLAFFMAQAERLRQKRADADGQRAPRQAHRRSQRRTGQVTETGLRALVIDERTPVAGHDAGSQAMLSHMRALQRLGYAVSFAAAEDMAPTDAAAKALTDADITQCSAPFYTSVEDVLRRQATCFDLVYLHRADTAAQYLALARRCNPQARIVYSVADLHHVRLARQAAIEDRPEVLAASRRLRLAECVAARSANAVITHSAVEVDALRRLAPQASLHRVAWDVPLAQTQVPFAGRRGIAFIGAYAHAPNADAAHWLAETIMPLVWRTDPSISCLLVGTDMPQSVRRLARPGIVAVGQVGDLGAAVFDRVRLTAAPLRYGAGVNGKILASLAAGVPCAMSTVAAEGMPLCRTLGKLVGSDAGALAALICKLHNDGSANARAAVAGLTMIGRHFSAATVTASLQDAIAGGAVTIQPGQPAAQSTVAA